MHFINLLRINYRPFHGNTMSSTQYSILMGLNI
jgi:hypothetical protein